MTTPRRKIGETYESYVERLIREAREEGAFDHLPGEGNPLPLTGALEEGWWIKEKLEREKLSVLPESIGIRHRAERVLAEVARLDDEREARARLEELNAAIRRLNATSVAGPPTTLAPLDVEAVLARWRAARARGGAAGAAP